MINLTYDLHIHSCLSPCGDNDMTPGNIAGMELTTLEEVHVICLFRTLDAAMDFDKYVNRHLNKVENNSEIFGEQIVMDENEQIKGYEKYLLINTTDLSFDDTFDLVNSFGGIMMPAHIDKTSTSVISNLGFIPPDSKFTCAEIKNFANLHKIANNNPHLYNCNIISNSDAHYLEHINESNYTILSKSKKIDDIIYALKTVNFPI